MPTRIAGSYHLPIESLDSGEQNLKLVNSILSEIDGEKSVQFPKKLPHDIKQTVGKMHLLIIDIFSKISTFFQILKNWFFGSKLSIKDIQQLALKKAYARKLTLYNEKKLPPEVKVYLKCLGVPLSSLKNLKDLDDIKKLDPNLFKLFKVIASKKGIEPIKSRLKAIKGGVFQQSYYLALITAIKFAKSQSVSNEVKNLLLSKLKKMPADLQLKNAQYRVLPKKAKRILFRATESREEEERGLSSKQKVAITAAGLVVLAAAGAIGYYYLMPSLATSALVSQQQAVGSESTVKLAFEGVREVGQKVGEILSEVGNQSIDVAPNFGSIRQASQRAGGFVSEVVGKQSIDAAQSLFESIRQTSQRAGGIKRFA